MKQSRAAFTLTLASDCFGVSTESDLSRQERRGGNGDPSTRLRRVSGWQLGCVKGEGSRGW